jgi:hypothetical protein
MVLNNDGSGLILRPGYDGKPPSIQNGPLTPNEEFVLDHLKWHWGGSEHVATGQEE